MLFQIVLDLSIFIIAILFLRWLWHRWFSKAEREESDILISKKVELKELRQRKEDLSETLGVTQEAINLQKEIDEAEKAVEELKKS